MIPHLPKVDLPTVEPAHLRAAAKRIRTASHAIDAPKLLLDQVTRRLKGAGRMDDVWTRSELQAVSLLLDHPTLNTAALGVLAANVRRLRTSGLAHAIAQKPSVAQLRREATRRCARGPLRGPHWLRCQTPATLATDDALLAHLSAQLRWRSKAIPDLLNTIDLSASAPLGRRVLVNGLRQHGSDILWPHVHANLSWALETVEDHKLARNMVDVILRIAQQKQPGDGPVRIAALEGLRDRYGGWADNPVRRERWGRHRPQTQALEKRFRIGRQLEQFFSKLHGDPDRLAYWRRWIDHIDEAEIYSRIHAFSMHIGGYVFVEFGKVGNALYVYEFGDWSSFNPRSARVEKDVKNKRTAIFTHSHSGDWQPKADRKVTNLTKRRPRP